MASQFHVDICTTCKSIPDFLSGVPTLCLWHKDNRRSYTLTSSWIKNKAKRNYIVNILNRANLEEQFTDGRVTSKYNLLK
jgi:hypothetical protein